MQRLTFESSPAFVLVCIMLGFGYAFLLYRAKYPWSKKTNRWLFALRAVLVTLLSFLLIGPILKLTNHLFEKPEIVFVIDNSSSLKEEVDSAKIENQLNEISADLKSRGYETSIKTLSEENIQKLRFDHRTSDLNNALKQTLVDY